MNEFLTKLTLDKGMSFPSTDELLYFIVNSSSKKFQKLSREILKVIQTSPSEDLLPNLLKINGITEEQALKIGATVELGKRFSIPNEIVISETKDIVPFIKKYTLEKQPYTICVMLSGTRSIIDIRVIAIGTGNFEIQKYEIFTEAVKQNARAIILAQTVDSDSRPTTEQLNRIEEIRKASNVLGIALLDFIYVTQTSHFSLVENGLL